MTTAPAFRGRFLPLFTRRDRGTRARAASLAPLSAQAASRGLNPDLTQVNKIP